jgi:hypothetical protein
MDKNMDKKIKKQKYVKPELKTIQLHADEVLSFGCKTPGSTGASLSANCGIGVSPCSLDGS